MDSGAALTRRPTAVRTWCAVASVAMVALLCGCAELLPRSHTEEPSPFASFEDARAAIEKVQPHRTSLEEMKALGLDPQASTNVREIPYPQLITLLVDSPSVAAADLDPGIGECIAARQACRAYQFHFSRVERDRYGNFLLDLLNFDRRTRTSGWRFQAIVLMRDDGVILFRNHAGEPRVDTNERTRNPLGPLQGVDVTRFW